MVDPSQETERMLFNPSIQVRKATSEDAAQIASVLLASFVEYRSQYTGKGFAATTPTAAQVARRTAEGPVWVALSGNRVVGTISAVPRAPTTSSARHSSLWRRTWHQTKEEANHQDTKSTKVFMVLKSRAFLVPLVSWWFNQ